MIHRMFTIHDSAAKAYLPPFILPEVGQALRMFTNAVNSKNHQFNQNPEDFILFEIAEFDDNKAKLGVLQVPINHGSGLQFKSNGSGPVALNSEERTP